MKQLIVFCALSLISLGIVANNEDPNFLHHFTTEAKKGDGVYKLLSRHELLDYSCNEAAFYQINGIKKGASIMMGKTYALPIKVYKYDNKSIRSTIGKDDWDLAKSIAKYNRKLRDERVKEEYYVDDNILLVPFHLINCPPVKKIVQAVAAKETIEKEKKSFVYSTLFGNDNRAEKKSTKLQKEVFYVISGHGGPDPGAMNTSMKTDLCEDEYAYDVSLRLARNLMQHGATVHMIIQDKNDGIRKGTYLNCDHDEVCIGNKAIPLDQRLRLRQRVRATNDLYKKEKLKGSRNHTVIAIHVDSRNAHKRQDVFFYHAPKSDSGKKIANKVQQVFKDKYKIHRANGQYHGSVSERPLYVLKYTDPAAVFVELANIKNHRDLKRIVQWDNRQILADWLFEGLTSFEP